MQGWQIPSWVPSGQSGSQSWSDQADCKVLVSDLGSGALIPKEMEFLGRLDASCPLRTLGRELLSKNLGVVCPQPIRVPAPQEGTSK